MNITPIGNYLLQLAKHQRIETDRLVLRPVTLEDTSDFLKIASNEVTTFYMQRFQANNLEEAAYRIANYMMREPLGIYGMELKDTHQFIGVAELEVQDEFSGEIGYILNQNFEGHGYMSEAMQALIQIGFEQVGFERIYARFDIKNTKSGRLIQKLGMKEEGVLRHLAKNPKGEWKDRAYYSMLKEEYFEGRSSDHD